MKPCKPYAGYIDARGFGRLHPHAKVKHLAHRYYWEQAHGPIPKGVRIRHTCGNKACVEISHLKAKLRDADLIAEILKENTDECIEGWSFGTRHGYARLSIGGKASSAARIIWTAAHGDPGSLQVLHRCDNPKCINVRHLFLGTCRDNAQDMLAKNRAAWQREPYRVFAQSGKRLKQSLERRRQLLLDLAYAIV